MIAADQPTFLPGSVVVRVSSQTDGTMLDRSEAIPRGVVLENRYRFCAAAGTDYDKLVHQIILYDDEQTYDRIEEVDEALAFQFNKDGVAADALFTRAPGVGFFLPVGDCAATVIYDPKNHYLALMHLGRHSTLTDIIPKMVEKFVSHGSHADDLVAWMSPSAGRNSYKLQWFDAANDPEWLPFRDVKDDGFYLDMQGFNRQRCLSAGLLEDNIHISAVDTMASDDYFSHATGDRHGRMAVLALLR